MNCQNGSCSLRRPNSSNGFKFGQPQLAPLMNNLNSLNNLQGAAFQKFGNNSFGNSSFGTNNTFGRSQGLPSQAFNPQMFANMRPF